MALLGKRESGGSRPGPRGRVDPPGTGRTSASSPKHHPEQPGSSTTDTLPAAAHHSRQLFFISSSLYYFLPAHIVMIPLCENFMFVYVFAIKNSGEEMKLPKCLASYRST